MGLFDSLVSTNSGGGLLGQNFDDPRSAAIMALSAGLLQRNLAGGLIGANNAYAQGKESQRRAAMEQMQFDMMKEDRELKRQQMQQAIDTKKAADAWWQSKMGGGAPAYQAGQLGSGSFGAIPNPNAMAPARQSTGGGLASFTPEDVVMAEKYGYKVVEPWKVAKQGFELKPNSFRVDPSTNAREYIPDVKEGVQYQNGVSSNIPGYLEMQTQRTLATEAPKALLQAAGRLNMRPGADGKEYPVPELSENPVLQGILSNVLNGGAGGVPARGTVPQGAAPTRAPSSAVPPAGPTTIPPDAQRAADQDAMKIIRSELASATDPQVRAGLERELARFEAAQSRPGFPTTTAAVTAAPTPGQGYGKTTEQKIADKAAEEQAIGLAKDVAEQRKQIMASGMSAPSNIARYRQIGALLSDVDGGRFTPLGTEFASALNSFGLKIDKNLPNKEAAAAIANEAALQLRNPAGGAGMPGAMSDSDRNFLASMTPSMAQSSQGRKQVIDAYVAVQSRNQQVAQFARNYEKKYGRLDNGFFDQLSAWSNSNPLFKGQ